MKIRWMIRKDEKSILNIEKQSFPEPWSKKDFDKTLENKNCIGQVCCDEDDNVLGYLIYEYDKESYHIINFAVAEGQRRHGLGKSLVQKLISHMENSNTRGRIFASVSDRNLTAQLFFRKLGFRAERISRNLFGKEHHAYEFVLPKTLNVKQKDELCQGV